MPKNPGVLRVPLTALSFDDGPIKAPVTVPLSDLRFDDDEDSAPGLRAQASVPAAASITASSAARGVQPSSRRTGKSAAQDIGVWAAKGVAAIPKAAIGLADIASQTPGAIPGIMGPVSSPSAIAKRAGYDPAAIDQRLDAMLSPAQRAANQAVSDASGVGGTLKAIAQNPSVIPQAVVESLPLMLAGGVAGRAVGAIAPRLAPVAGAIGEALAGAGSSAAQIGQETPGGLNTPQALIAGTSGALTGALGAVGAKVAKGLGIVDVDTMLATAATNPQARVSVVRAVLSGAVQEGAIEELPQSVQEQVAQNLALGRPLDTGVDQAAVLGAVTGAVMGAGGQTIAAGRKPSALPPPKPAPAEQAGPPVAPPVVPVPPAQAPPLPPPPAAGTGDVGRANVPTPQQPAPVPPVAAPLPLEVEPEPAPVDRSAEPPPYTPPPDVKADAKAGTITVPLSEVQVEPESAPAPPVAEPTGQTGEPAPPFTVGQAIAHQDGRTGRVVSVEPGQEPGTFSVRAEFSDGSRAGAFLGPGLPPAKFAVDPRLTSEPPAPTVPEGPPNEVAGSPAQPPVDDSLDAQVGAPGAPLPTGATGRRRRTVVPPRPPQDIPVDTAPTDRLGAVAGKKRGTVDPRAQLVNLTPPERRELNRVIAELDAIEYERKTFNYDTRGQGSTPDVVAGHGYAPTYGSIVGEIAPPKGGGKALAALLKDGRDKGQHPSVWWDRAVDLAKRRAAGERKALESVYLGIDAGDEPGAAWWDAYRDEAHAKDADQALQSAIERHWVELGRQPKDQVKDRWRRVRNVTEFEDDNDRAYVEALRRRASEFGWDQEPVEAQADDVPFDLDGLDAEPENAPAEAGEPVDPQVDDAPDVEPEAAESAPVAETPSRETVADEIRRRMGLSREAIDLYDPAQSVVKVGGKWTYRTLEGNEHPSLLATRKEAVAAAERHIALKSEQYDNPEGFWDVSSLRATERLRRIQELQRGGMSEMEAGKAASAEEDAQGRAKKPPVPVKAKAEATVRITGDEVGPGITDIKELRAAAANYYDRELRGRIRFVERPGFGRVAFTRPGRNKTIHNSANPDTLRLIAAVPDIIVRGEYLGASDPTDKHAKDAKAYHYFAADVQIGGRTLKGVEVTVWEDANGRKYWNVTADPAGNRNGVRGDPAAQVRGPEPQFEGSRKASLSESIGLSSEDVNIRIGGPAAMPPAKASTEPTFETTRPDLDGVEAYRNGDRIAFTGRSRPIAGGTFYEFTYLDGAKKGETGVTQNAPDPKPTTDAGPDGGQQTPADEPLAPGRDVRTKLGVEPMLPGGMEDLAKKLDESSTVASPAQIDRLIAAQKKKIVEQKQRVFEAGGPRTRRGAEEEAKLESLVSGLAELEKAKDPDAWRRKQEEAAKPDQGGLFGDDQPVKADPEKYRAFGRAFELYVRELSGDRTWSTPEAKRARALAEQIGYVFGGTAADFPPHLDEDLTFAFKRWESEARHDHGVRQNIRNFRDSMLGLMGKTPSWRDEPGSGGGGAGSEANEGMFTADPSARLVRPAKIPEARQATDAQAVEFPELVDLARDLLGAPPKVKKSLGKALGLFKHTDGPGGRGEIRLRADLFTQGNEAQLAATLAHEIGHLIDWLPSRTLKRGNLLGRLRTLDSYLKHTFTTGGGPLFGGADITLKDVAKELKDLSAYWRPWDEANSTENFAKYRNSSKELFADAISVLLNNPGLLEERAPIFFREFFNGLDAKPEVKRAYFELQERLSGTREELVARRRAGVRAMLDEGDVTALELERRRQREAEGRRKNLWFRLKTEIADRNYRVIDLVKNLEKRGTRIPKDQDPRYLLEERRYLGGKLKGFTERHFVPVFKAVQDAGIGWSTFGESLFYERIIAGDRSDIANPRGLSPSAAQEVYDRLREGLTDDQRATLDAQLRTFRAAVRRAARDAYDAGLYSAETWAQIEDNEKYATFQVIEHLDDGMSSRIHQQIGTLKDIVNPADSSILKTLITIRATEHQRVKRGTVDFLKRYTPGDIEPAKTVWTGRGHKPIEPKSQDQRLVTLFDQGKPVGYYVDPFIAGALDQEDIGRNLAILEGLKIANNKLFRPVFTTFNLGFQGFNAMRDFLRFWKNVPGMTMGRALKRYYQAIPLAKARGFGMTDETTAQIRKDLLDAEEARMLSVTFNDMAAGRVVEDTQIADILSRTGIDGFTTRKDGVVPRQVRAVLDWIEHAGNFVETLPKAAGIYEFRGDGSISQIPADKRSFIRRKVGSPDILAGGTLKPITNEVFLFSNAITQALRSDFEVATGPTTRSGFWWKTVAINMLPKVLMAAAVGGAFGEGLKNLMRKASEYDLTNYTVIPLGTDASGDAIYLRIPQDDSGRLLGALLWKMIGLADGEKDALKGLGQIIDYSAGQFPGLTPAIDVVSDTVSFLSGRNPYDNFRARPVFTDEEWKARDWGTVKKFIGYEFQNIGGGIVWKFYPGEDRPKRKSTGQRILELPVVSNVVGRFIRISSYGDVERMRTAQGRVEREEARQRRREREAVHEAIKAGATDAKTAAADVARKLYGDDAETIQDRKPSLTTMLKTGLARQENDPVIDAVLAATSNRQKIAILETARRGMSDQAFQSWLAEARSLGVVSDDVAQAVGGVVAPKKPRLSWLRQR